jgi:hypothetical protein
MRYTIVTYVADLLLRTHTKLWRYSTTLRLDKKATFKKSN